MGINLDTFSKNVSKAKVYPFILSQDNNLNLQLFVKRDDLIHNEISGNKWRKLKWNIISTVKHGCDLISTYGGAYSNHLLATAALGYEVNVKTRGYVRGHELAIDSNHILSKCSDLNMELLFISREEYDRKKKTNGIIPSSSRIWNIPEGGSNREGVKGCLEIMRETTNDFDYVVVAQGTTTTSLGLLESMNPKTKLIVVPILKGFDSINEMKNLASICDLSINESKIIVLDKYHFGGYSKSNDTLDQFIIQFNKQADFTIEPVYTGKVLYALKEYAKDNSLTGKKVLFIHTGGLNNV